MSGVEGSFIRLHMTAKALHARSHIDRGQPQEGRVGVGKAAVPDIFTASHNPSILCL